MITDSRPPSMLLELLALGLFGACIVTLCAIVN